MSKNWKISEEQIKANASKAGKASITSPKYHKLTKEDAAKGAPAAWAALQAKYGGVAGFVEHMAKKRAEKKAAKEAVISAETLTSTQEQFVPDYGITEQRDGHEPEAFDGSA